jgi:hypothetical protein
MTDTKYIPIAQYQGQQVYYDILHNQVYLEKDHTKLVTPTREERKGLIDEGIVKIINGIIAEVVIKTTEVKK